MKVNKDFLKINIADSGSFDCEVYSLVKLKRIILRAKQVCAIRVGQLIYINLYLIKLKDKNPKSIKYDHEYLILIIDDYFYIRFVIPLSKKSDVSEEL